MNPVVLLPILAAACLAVPAGHHAAVHTYNAVPAVAYHHAPAAAVAYTAQVSVPIQKTVHYESRPVVTGYQTSIIKPAIATHTVAAPVFAQPAVVAAPAPVVVAGDYYHDDSQPTQPPFPSQPAPPSFAPPTQPQIPGQPGQPGQPGEQGQAPPPPPPGVCLLPNAQQPPGQNLPPCPTPAPAPAAPAFPNFPNLPGFPNQPPPAGQPGGAGAGEGGSQSNPPQEGGPQFPSIPGGGLPAFPSFPQFIQGVQLIPEQPAAVAVQPVQPVAVPAAPAPVEVAQPAPAPEAVQSDDTAIIENPEFRSAAAPVQTVQTANIGYAATPAFTTYAAAPALHHTYAAAPVLAPVVVRAAAPHFDQLVTKEKVLAPVRTHTHITPQVTQVQPEVTVRKVIQDVPVAQPVVQYTAGPSPVIHQTVHAAPAVHHTHSAAVPALHHTHTYAAAPALHHNIF